MIDYHIILPSYHYYKGTKRILKQIYLAKTKNIFLYIFDNTTNDKIKNLYIKFKNKLNIYYVKNRPTLTPATNWNKSLTFLNKKFNSEIFRNQNYIMILHHDEYFKDKNFFLKLTQLIKHNNYPNVVSITTLVNYESKLRNKIHTTSFQRSLFHKYYFDYIFLRNYIGPMSSLIIKYQKKIPLFNEKLKWLIDVEFYKKIKIFNKWIFTDDIFLFSDQKNDVSLTLKYRSKINELYKKEIKMIANKFDLKILLLDNFIWGILRILNKFKYWIDIKKYSDD